MGNIQKAYFRVIGFVCGYFCFHKPSSLCCCKGLVVASHVVKGGTNPSMSKMQPNNQWELPSVNRLRRIGKLVVKVYHILEYIGENILLGQIVTNRHHSNNRPIYNKSTWYSQYVTNRLVNEVSAYWFKHIAFDLAC